MASKQYISTTGVRYVFPVVVDDKRVYVEFSGPKNEFVTDNEDVQKALEESEKFKKKAIVLAKEFGTEKTEKPGTKFDPAVFEDVTDINGAIEVLKGDPYKIKATQLKTPEKVKEQAEACNVSFPNWV